MKYGLQSASTSKIPILNTIYEVQQTQIRSQTRLRQKTTIRAFNAHRARAGATIRAMSSAIDTTTRDQEQVDLTQLSPPDLIARINALQSKLKATTAELAALNASTKIASKNDSTTSTQAYNAAQTTTGTITANGTSAPFGAPKIPKKPKAFDMSAHATRHIALKFSYIGSSYNGFEHANNANSAPAKPTIEEVLWKALRKTRLIDPEIPEGADASYEVVWDEKERATRYGVGTVGRGAGRKGLERLEVIWDGLAYSKCGRTDKGVSAFGQVIGITVRSNKPKGAPTETENSDSEAECSFPDVWSGHPDRDELPYISLLNKVLPPTIRILAWCPKPPPSFDARFSCQERQYKYLFTNPAMCPTPGQLGFQNANGSTTSRREGWLDIDAMRIAAKKLEGLHDYRNLCKLDATKQMSNCQRRITFADIEEFNDGMNSFMMDTSLNERGTQLEGTNGRRIDSLSHDALKPKVYAFAVHGTAFLWHQVRCMVAVLFLVGQGLEKPEIIDELLDIEQNPAKPNYEMADDSPLVLWNCVFPGDQLGDQKIKDDGVDAELSKKSVDENSMQWFYAGDELGLPATVGRGDGKFGHGGIIEQLWSQWREAKIRETLAASLLGLALKQGDGSAFTRGGSTSIMNPIKDRSQRVFVGSDHPRSVGTYIPVMQKSRLDTLEVQNAKMATGKLARKNGKRNEEPSQDR